MIDLKFGVYMTDTAVLMLGMPFAMLSTFSVIVAVMALTLLASVIVLGLICFLTQKFMDWLDQRAVKKLLAGELGSVSPAWASPKVVGYSEWDDDQW